MPPLAATISRRTFLSNHADGIAAVLAATCMEADAWATVLLVLGEHAGQKLTETLQINAIFVFRDGTLLSTL